MKTRESAHDKVVKLLMERCILQHSSLVIFKRSVVVIFNVLFYGSPFDVPFSFAMNVRARKCEIAKDQSNKMFLELPCVWQIDRFYREFLVKKKTGTFCPKSGTKGYFPHESDNVDTYACKRDPPYGRPVMSRPRAATSVQMRNRTSFFCNSQANQSLVFCYNHNCMSYSIPFHCPCLHYCLM